MLDDATVNRIKDCKKHGFPICLEESLNQIFKEPSQNVLIERIMNKLGLRTQEVYSAEQIWMIYDQVMSELSRLLGTDVSEVIEFQTLKEMERIGCTLCPLYQRQLLKTQGC